MRSLIYQTCTEYRCMPAPGTQCCTGETPACFQGTGISVKRQITDEQTSTDVSRLQTLPVLCRDTHKGEEGGAGSGCGLVSAKCVPKGGLGCL